MMGQVTLLALTFKHVFLSVLGIHCPELPTTCIYHILWNLPQTCASFFCNFLFPKLLWAWCGMDTTYMPNAAAIE
jgi:hypothetical protein